MEYNYPRKKILKPAVPKFTRNKICVKKGVTQNYKTAKHVELTSISLNNTESINIYRPNN